MARLNIEERCFAHSSVRHLAKLMKWTRREALGCLAILWHDSQELEKSFGTVNEIEVWCECKDEKEAILLCDALVTAGFIVPSSSEPGSFYIKGNKEQVESIRAHRVRARAGGEANKRRWQKSQSNDSNELSENDRATSELEAMPQAMLQDSLKIAASIAQCNSTQSKAKQSKTTQKEDTTLVVSSESEPQAAPAEAVASASDAAQGTLIRDPNEEKKSRGKTYPPEHHPLARIWNEHCGTLPKVARLNETRLKHARARWAEESNDAYWIEVVGRISRSKFCNGSGSTGWRANFDFLLQPTTHIKALEGRYDDRAGGLDRSTYAQRRSSNNMALAEKVIKGEL